MSDGRSLGPALGAVVAGLAAAAVLGRLATIVTGSGPGRRAVALLLLETTYVLVASCCLGSARGRAARSARSLAATLGPALMLAVAAVLSAEAWAPVLVAQAPVAATFVLGAGIGRAARDVTGRSSAAAAVAGLSIVAFALSLLAVSHLSPWLSSTPRAGAMLLALDPYVAVSSAAGFDLVRARVLYDELTLAGHRFVYPTPPVSTALLTLCGLVLGRFRPRAWGASPGTRASSARPAMPSSREVSA